MKPYDHQRLDEVIHSRIRLAVMALLASVEEADFTFIRDAVQASDGNLSVHLRKLEEARYVQVSKRFLSRKPLSSYRLTAAGRQAFARYVDRLEQFLGASKKG